MKRPKLKVGDVVRSTYRARWTGVVVDVGRSEHSMSKGASWVMAKPTHTVDGRPIRKGKARKLSPYWLELVCRENNLRRRDE